jgi:hypothetical protein
VQGLVGDHRSTFIQVVHVIWDYLAVDETADVSVPVDGVHGVGEIVDSFAELRAETTTVEVFFDLQCIKAVVDEVAYRIEL